VYETEQVAEAVNPDRVQVPVNEPAPLVVSVTVPVGVRYVPGDVSVTVTVQVVAVATVAGDVHETDVETALWVTVTDCVASGLAAVCPASPP